MLLYQAAGNRTFYSPDHFASETIKSRNNAITNTNKQEIIRGIYFGIYSGILFCVSTLFSNSSLFNMSATAAISFCQGGANGVRRFGRGIVYWKTILNC